MFPRDNIPKTVTVMHNPVFEHTDTLPFALLAWIILYMALGRSAENACL